MENLISLLYISRSLPNQSDDDIADILQISRSKNLEKGITGVLCSGGEHFIQVLEGPQQTVLESYLRILDDSRHKNCFLIGMATLESRNFENWSMGYINISQEKILERRRQLMRYWKSQSKDTELIKLMRLLLT